MREVSGGGVCGAGRGGAGGGGGGGGGRQVVVVKPSETRNLLLGRRWRGECGNTRYQHPAPYTHHHTRVGFPH